MDQIYKNQQRKANPASSESPKKPSKGDGSKRESVAMTPARNAAQSPYKTLKKVQDGEYEERLSHLALHGNGDASPTKKPEAKKFSPVEAVLVDLLIAVQATRML